MRSSPARKRTCAASSRTRAACSGRSAARRTERSRRRRVRRSSSAARSRSGGRPRTRRGSRCSRSGRGRDEAKSQGTERRTRRNAAMADHRVERLRSIVRAMVARAADGKPGDGRHDSGAQERPAGKLFAAMANPFVAAHDRAKVRRGNANETYFKGRDLEYILMDPFPVQYEKMTHRDVVPVVPLPEGSGSYTYRMGDETGEAELSANLAGAVPDIDVNTTETPTKRYFVKEKYHYTIEDL